MSDDPAEEFDEMVNWCDIFIGGMDFTIDYM
jgi:hypothetical protein